MELNPYAKYLADQDPRAVIAATPGLLHLAVCALTPEQIEAPRAPGKWSPARSSRTSPTANSSSASASVKP